MPQLASSILWPMLAHIGWVVLLYAWLTYARTQAVRRGEVDYSSFELDREEPLAVARIRRNLANQFELPVIFYALVVLLIALGKVTMFDVVAAWVFVAGRVDPYAGADADRQCPAARQCFHDQFSGGHGLGRPRRADRVRGVVAR